MGAVASRAKKAVRGAGRAGAAEGRAGAGAIAPARRCAYAVVRRVFERGAYADLALAAEAQAHRLDARDRALAMRLAYGTVQRRRALDHVLAALSERAPSRLDAPVLGALRLGLYELCYLDGAPARAVVADAVELAKVHARGGHQLVNAVLRRAAREGPHDLIGALPDASPEQAAVKHSHPDWIARLWWSELGSERARSLMAAGNEPSEVALRANTLVNGAAELAAKLASVRTHLDGEIPEALVLEGPFDAHASPLWRVGAFAAQSRAAMLVSRTLAPQPGERVLDVCAAPGGKTTHLAALMEGRGVVVAVERDARRAQSIARAAARLKAPNVEIEVRDGALATGDEAFDRVLVDPPCSGLGTLAARADLRWRMTEAKVAEMARSQGELLAAGARAVRPGGVLVYSTCTISSDENEHVIGAFLDSHSAFSLDDLAAERPAIALERSRPSAAAGGGVSPRPAPALNGPVQTLPDRDRTAGFFIARMRRS